LGIEPTPDLDPPGVEIRGDVELAILLIALGDPGPTAVPEGGSALLYLLLAGTSCFGCMFYSRHKPCKWGRK